VVADHNDCDFVEDLHPVQEGIVKGLDASNVDHLKQRSEEHELDLLSRVCSEIESCHSKDESSEDED